MVTTKLELSILMLLHWSNLTLTGKNAVPDKGYL